MRAFYCKMNDILVYAPTKKAAEAYARHKLSPAYGHAPNRADNLNLKPISKARAEDLDGSSITWETED